MSSSSPSLCVSVSRSRSRVELWSTPTESAKQVLSFPLSLCLGFLLWRVHPMPWPNRRPCPTTGTALRCRGPRPPAATFSRQIRPPRRLADPLPSPTTTTDPGTRPPSTVPRRPASSSSSASATTSATAPPNRACPRWSRLAAPHPPIRPATSRTTLWPHSILRSGTTRAMQPCICGSPASPARTRSRRSLRRR